jgi:hypothetical protein
MIDNTIFVTCVLEETLSLCRTLGFQEFEAPRIYRQPSLQGGKVISPANWRLFPRKKPLVSIYVKS